MTTQIDIYFSDGLHWTLYHNSDKKGAKKAMDIYKKQHGESRNIETITYKEIEDDNVVEIEPGPHPEGEDE